MPAKHAACKAHVLLECGDKVCVVPGVNGDAHGVMTEAAKRQLERFHAYVHRVAAKAHAAEAKRPRPKNHVRRGYAPKLEIRKSKFHRHSARCRAPITEKLSTTLNGAYVQPPTVVTGYFVDGRNIEVPAHANLTIRYVTGGSDVTAKRRNRDYGPHYFAKIYPSFALEKCRVTGQPIPAKRPPAILTKTYLAYAKAHQEGRPTGDTREAA